MSLSLDPASAVVGDTHALLWYMADDKRLSDPARGFLEEVDNHERLLIVPAVVVAEMLMAVEKQRVPVPMPALLAILRQWRTAPNVRMSPLTPELIMDAMSLTHLPEIFDRLIVAEALALNAPVITRDVDITVSKVVRVIW